MSNLKDKVVVLTGASSGIGRAAALEFASEGAHLALAARNESALTEVAEACMKTGVRAIVVPTDVSDASAMEHLAQKALESFGHIDIWINNAGVYMLGRVEDVPVHAQRRLFEINVFGCINGIAAVMPHFRTRGRGTLIQTASVAAKSTYALAGTYCASKHAVLALSEAVRQETVGTDIHVVSVVPAGIDTPLFQHSANFTGQAIKAMAPVYTPERVAHAFIKAAKRPRREIKIGAAPRLFSAVHTLAPGLYERRQLAMVKQSHLEKRPANETNGNLYEPSMMASVHGGWKQASHWLRNVALAVAALLPVGLAARKLLKG